MSYVLRPYQEEAADAGLAFLRRVHHGEPEHGLLVEPTGSGKSLIIAKIATELNEPTLVFQPTKELLEQNASKLIEYGYIPTVFSDSFKSRDIGPITLATIGSVVQVAELFKHVKHVLVDEAHLVNSKAGMYREFLSALPEARILGLTATPFRLSSDAYGGSKLKFLTRTRPKVFSELVHYTQIQHLVENGWWTPLEYQKVLGFDRQQLLPNTTGADYSDASVKQHFKKVGFGKRLVRVVNRLLEVGRPNVLVFTRYVDEADELIANVPGGVVITAKTPKGERAAALEAFKLGQIPVVANVGVLTTGFDFPALSTVVLARPTMSLGLFYQMVGRACRPHPSKASAWIVDMVDLVGQFGKVEDLMLRAGGRSGDLWEFVSGDKVLTNVYYGEGNKFARDARLRKKAKQWQNNQW